MIDLGDELAGYGEQPQTPSKPPDGMGSFGKLADLQVAGFDIDPRRADADPQWSFTAPGSFTIDAGPLVNDPRITRIVAGAAGITPGGAGGGLMTPWPMSTKRYDPPEIEAKTWPPGDNDGFEPTGSISGDDNA